jgi:hypothetical protein
MSYVVELPNNSYKPITNTAWVRARLCKLQERCTSETDHQDIEENRTYTLISL